jgi:hypothetical protein
MNLKEGGNLRDVEFSEYLIENLPYLNLSFDYSVFSILKKEKITNNDLLRFYFAFSDEDIYDYSFAHVLFDYKMGKISNERVKKFAEIVKGECGYGNITGRISYRGLWELFSGSTLFYKMVDRFLDEI